jgi:hypothetical protein
MEAMAHLQMMFPSRPPFISLHFTGIFQPGRISKYCLAPEKSLDKQPVEPEHVTWG